jgi:hypothetical protein
MSDGGFGILIGTVGAGSSVLMVGGFVGTITGVVVSLSTLGGFVGTVTGRLGVSVLTVGGFEGTEGVTGLGSVLVDGG